MRVRDYDLDEPFVCRISELEWSQLCEEFDLDGPKSESNRYVHILIFLSSDVLYLLKNTLLSTFYRLPRFSYNSAISTLKIYTIPSCLHEIIINFLHKHFTLLFDRVLSNYLLKRIDIFTNLTIRTGFEAEYEGSTKIPDLGIFVRNNNTQKMELKWALEVGFSEKYNDLQKNIGRWLIGQPTCAMVVLIKITESPKYRRPPYTELNIPQNQSEILEEDFSLRGEYGPVEFKGYQWVGQISEVFLEIWTRHPETGEPRRRIGRQTSIIPPTDLSPQFELAEFLDIDGSQMISFDWDELRGKLKDYLRSEAHLRCCMWLRESKKRVGMDDKADRPS